MVKNLAIRFSIYLAVWIQPNCPVHIGSVRWVFGYRADLVCVCVCVCVFYVYINYVILCRYFGALVLALGPRPDSDCYLAGHCIHVMAENLIWRRQKNII